MTGAETTEAPAESETESAQRCVSFCQRAAEQAFLTVVFDAGRENVADSEWRSRYARDTNVGTCRRGQHVQSVRRGAASDCDIKLVTRCARGRTG